MCIGIPMRVIETGYGHSLCEGMGLRRHIDTMLVGDQPEGTWLLVFQSTAREVLEPEHAIQISDGLQALSLMMQGETNVDDLFADLAGREPELPPFLRQSVVKE